MSRSSTDEDARYVEGIRSLQESILNDISKNDVFRKCIVEYSPLDQNENDRDDISEKENPYAYSGSNPLSPCLNTKRISEFIDESVPERFSGQGDHFDFIVCGTSADDFPCSLPGSIEGKKEAYTSAVIITSSLDNEEYNPRILRVWFF